MADYARKGDQARWMSSQSRQTRRLRTARPRRGHVAGPTFIAQGQITMDTFFPPKLVTIDPVSEGDYPEHKQIVAVDGWLSVGGPVMVSWSYNEGYFYEEHEISGGSNRIVLPEPFLIENGDTFGGEWIRPVIAEEPAFDCFHIALTPIIETVPV